MPTTGCRRAGGSPSAASIVSAAAPTSARCSTGEEHTLPPMAQVTWIGHGTVLVDLDGVRLLTDPLLRNRVAHLRRHAPLPPAEALRGIDAVLLTHLHRDHLDLPSLRRVGRDVPIVVPRGGGGLLLRRGFDGVREIAPGRGGRDRRAAASRRRRPPPRRPRRRRRARARRSAIVVAGSRRIYHAGDTDLFDGMRAIGATGSTSRSCRSGAGRSRLGPGHLDPLRAAQALVLLHPRRAVPIHWGTYAVGPAARRPPRYLQRAARAVPGRGRARARSGRARSCALEPGESLEL